MCKFQGIVQRFLSCQLRVDNRDMTLLLASLPRTLCTSPIPVNGVSVHRAGWFELHDILVAQLARAGL